MPDNDYFNRMIRWFAEQVDVLPEEILGQAYFPAGDDSWSVEIFDGRERISAIVYEDENGDFTYSYSTLSYR